MFVVEISAGLAAHSTSLIADSLDMLGDALAYSFSLFAVSRGVLWQARSAIFKGGIMALFGIFVVSEAIYKMIFPVLPHAETMGVIGALALVANSVCLLLLWHHRGDDINMRSVWLCSRNDIIANISVILAAAAVAISHNLWPDIIVGLAIAALFLRSAWQVLVSALKQLKNNAG